MVTINDHGITIYQTGVTPGMVHIPAGMPFRILKGPGPISYVFFQNIQESIKHEDAKIIMNHYRETDDKNRIGFDR